MRLTICFSLFGEGQSLVCSAQGILGELGECRWIIPLHLMDGGCGSQPDACLLASHSMASSAEVASSRKTPVTRLAGVARWAHPKLYWASDLSEHNVRMEVSPS